MNTNVINPAYAARRGKVQTYFDVTAADTWAKLTSDAPVSKIRATVRAGRDQMRATLMSWLPSPLLNVRLLDAGCGTGALAVEAAQRGAKVTAVDLSPTLIQLAKERVPNNLNIDFRAGDLVEASLGEFDVVVSMDCLIHYSAKDAVAVLEALAQRTSTAILFTFAPSNPFLKAAVFVGRAFPKGDRSPSIEPVAENYLRHLIENSAALKDWHCARTLRIKSGFYTSQAMELLRK